MERICDICRLEYELLEKPMGPHFWPIVCGDNVRITRYDGDHTYIYHFNVCPDCSMQVLNYIKKH